MTNILKRSDSDVIKRRFERDAVAFDAIYNVSKSEFSSWFNKAFRKPIFERCDITFQVLGDLSNKSVLDVGCGSGVYSTQCAMNGAARVKGIDFSASMLELAKKRADTHHMSTVCEFELIDFLQMKEDEQFDFAIVMGVFDYLPDPLIFLKKLKAVTKHRIVASFPGHSLIREPLRKLRYLLTSKGRVHFYTYQEIQNLAEIVEFRRVEIRPMQTGSGFVLIADVC